MYKILYLPMAEFIRDLASPDKNKNPSFATRESAQLFIENHKFLLSKRNKAPFTIEIHNNFYVYRTFDELPKHLLEIVEI